MPYPSELKTKLTELPKEGDANENEMTTKKADNATGENGEHSDVSVVGKNKSVGRFDTVESMQWMASPFVRTPEGFLKGRAIVTSVGVFEYRSPDGGTAFELRLPEEVFAYDSLESLKMKPLANDHPKEVVTPENVKKYQVGSLGDNPGSMSESRDWSGASVPREQRSDGMHLAIDMMITEAGAIQDVLNGKQALSCGYTCDLEESSGRWCGVKYDYIQRRIRYNHVAIVDEARAGDAARIRLDSADAVMVNNIIQEADMPGAVMKKITLDSVEYEAEAKVLETLNAEKKRADDASSNLDKKGEELSKVCAERDALKDKCGAMQKELDALKKQMDSADEEGNADSADNPFKARVDAAVAKRLVVLDAAKKAGVEKVDGVSNSELMKQVIVKVSPEAKLDGKDSVYIQARFDATIENLETQVKNDASVRSLGGEAIPHSDGGSGSQKGERTAEQARADMIERMKNPDKDVKGEK